MTDTKPTADEVIAALAHTETVAQAARLLGVSERTLYRRMETFGIKVRRVPVQEVAA